jgi:hypothetical protein
VLNTPAYSATMPVMKKRGFIKLTPGLQSFFTLFLVLV